MKITNAGGRSWEIDHWSVKVERARLRHLGSAQPWRRHALVLVGPRRDHHNPPSCRPLEFMDGLAFASLVEPVCDLLGLPIPKFVRDFSRLARGVMMGRIAREAFADEGVKSKKERRQERRRKR